MSGFERDIPGHLLAIPSDNQPAERPPGLWRLLFGAAPEPLPQRPTVADAMISSLANRPVWAADLFAG